MAASRITGPEPPVPHVVLLGASVFFNDAILRAAFEQGAAVIDLRLVCSEPEDYATPIEPSVRGGEKIARAIAGAVLQRGAPPGRSEVFR